MNADRVVFEHVALVVAIERRVHKQLFELKLSPDGKELRGTLKADPYVFPIKLLKTPGA